METIHSLNNKQSLTVKIPKDQLAAYLEITALSGKGVRITFKGDIFSVSSYDTTPAISEKKRQIKLKYPCDRFTKSLVPTSANI